jgi:hypothetical protein
MCAGTGRPPCKDINFYLRDPSRRSPESPWDYGSLQQRRRHLSEVRSLISGPD